ncbi:MAG: hypothetical protein A2X36_14005 [Elusimicrobia bacterium GWA2_69_24]|nr:MAG: hypothetical protein A2X36_14005 [Elusimicrobia bacterium GWA2_69_24]HBL16685.1 hypothetical protein [Elusimicrobiota bacterium]
MRKSLLLAAPLTLFAACIPQPLQVRQPPPEPAFRAVDFVPGMEWPELSDDLDPASFEAAAQRSAAYLEAKGDHLMRIGDREVAPRLLIETLEEVAALLKAAPAGQDLRPRLKERFDLYRVRPSSAPRSAHFSSYYQPVIAASRERTAEYSYPLYGKPPDMVDADLGGFDPALQGKTIVGRVTPEGRFAPYFDRRDIDIRKSLEGKGLEIAWLKDSFDRLNLHIQGSGLLQFTDGTTMMARFAATNARPYKSVGLSVAGSGAMTRDKLTNDTLHQYLREHPEGEAWLLSQNPRYTFFELVDLPADAEPLGTMNQPLTAGRSIAVDPEFVPLGALAFMSFPMAQADAEGRLLGKGPVHRFVLCHDTGGAIKGPGRVDVYVGHGAQAQTTAHRVWDKGNLYLLIKKLPPRQR